eukprot:gb/GEZN01000886.1/.p1 GENE.gb/GEZN01000886.1/~~gb/GEZN01000886.1/.p1  ORF type:complete len:1102 (+),score=128.75 gb/GEZN01000886.1/:119-3424(+)
MMETLSQNSVPWHDAEGGRRGSLDKERTSIHLSPRGHIPMNFSPRGVSRETPMLLPPRGGAFVSQTAEVYAKGAEELQMPSLEVREDDKAAGRAPFKQRNSLPRGSLEQRSSEERHNRFPTLAQRNNLSRGSQEQRSSEETRNKLPSLAQRNSLPQASHEQRNSEESNKKKLLVKPVENQDTATPSSSEAKRTLPSLQRTGDEKETEEQEIKGNPTPTFLEVDEKTQNAHDSSLLVGAAAIQVGTGILRLDLGLVSKSDYADLHEQPGLGGVGALVRPPIPFTSSTASLMSRSHPSSPSGRSRNLVILSGSPTHANGQTNSHSPFSPPPTSKHGALLPRVEKKWFREWTIRANTEFSKDSQPDPHSQQGMQQDRFFRSFFHHLRTVEISHWSFCIKQFFLFTVSKQHWLREAILATDWPDYLFSPIITFCEGSDFTEEDLEKLITPLMAIVHELVKHHFNSWCSQHILGISIKSCIANLYRYCPDYRQAETLSRSLLRVAVSGMSNSAERYKDDWTHVGWANLTAFSELLYEFVFFSPTPRSKKKVTLRKTQVLNQHEGKTKENRKKRFEEYKKTTRALAVEEKVMKLHYDSTGCTDEKLVESLVDLLSVKLKVFKIMEFPSGGDREKRRIQKRLFKFWKVELSFWRKMHLFFSQLALFGGVSGAAERVVAEVLDALVKRNKLPNNATTRKWKEETHTVLLSLVHAVSMATSSSSFGRSRSQSWVDGGGSGTSIIRKPLKPSLDGAQTIVPKMGRLMPRRTGIAAPSGIRASAAPSSNINKRRSGVLQTAKRISGFRHSSLKLPANGVGNAAGKRSSRKNSRDGFLAQPRTSRPRSQSHGHLDVSHLSSDELFNPADPPTLCFSCYIPLERTTDKTAKYCAKCFVASEGNQAPKFVLETSEPASIPIDLSLPCSSAVDRRRSNTLPTLTRTLKLDMGDTSGQNVRPILDDPGQMDALDLEFSKFLDATDTNESRNALSALDKDPYSGLDSSPSPDILASVSTTSTVPSTPSLHGSQSSCISSYAPGFVQRTNVEHLDPSSRSRALSGSSLSRFSLSLTKTSVSHSSHESTAVAIMTHDSIENTERASKSRFGTRFSLFKRH